MGHCKQPIHVENLIESCLNVHLLSCNHVLAIYSLCNDCFCLSASCELELAGMCPCFVLTNCTA